MVWGYALTIGSIIAAFIFTGWQGGLTILFLAFVFSFTAAQSIYLHKTKERNLKFLGMVKPLAQSQLSAFLTGSGSNKPYRELVQYHIKRQSTKQLQLAVLGETSLLPEVYQPTIMSYIDATNNQLGASGNFWMQTTCRQAFEQIMNIAIEVLPLDGVITSVEDALKTNNHELAFQLFQITTLSFAYPASTQRNQRKFMGIRKGLFG